MIRTTKRLLPLALALAVLSPGCGKGPKDAPPAQPQAPAPTAPTQQPQQQQQQVSLVWGTGWSMRVRPVFSGAAIAAGDGTVTVTSWDNGPETVTYELPPYTTQAIKPEVAVAAEGVLRRTPANGTISIKPDAAHQAVFTPPAFWPGGASTSPGPLVWLPPEVTAALRGTNSARLKVAPLPSGLRMRTEPAQGSDAVTLSIEGKGEVVIPVNGKQTRLPAVRLVDDQGSTYTLLDSPQNPLVLRFRFGPSPVVDGKKLVLAAQSGYDVVSLSGPK